MKVVVIVKATKESEAERQRRSLVSHAPGFGPAGPADAIG
jgi:hypothetical protein